MVTPDSHMNGGIDDAGLLRIFEDLERTDPKEGNRRAVEFFAEKTSYQIIENPDGSFSVKSTKNPDAPAKNALERLLFTLRAKVRRTIKLH